MRRIAVINQKGGVGKTTTTVNVGSALARAGHRVLMIDLDPQAHMTLHLGLDPAAGRLGTYEMLTGSATIAKARMRVANNLWVVGSSIDLAAAELELVSVVGREVILRDLLDQHVGTGIAGHSVGKARTPQYDYVLMDCPPSLSVLTLNGLCAAHEIVIPLQPHYLALQGLGKLLETVSLVGKRINPGLSVAGVVICMHDAGTKLASEVIEDARLFFEQARGANVPWSSARLFETAIRRNIKLAEAPSYGKCIFDYAADSNGAQDYARLAGEIHDPTSLRAAVTGQETLKRDEAPLAKSAESVVVAESTAGSIGSLDAGGCDKMERAGKSKPAELDGQPVASAANKNGNGRKVHPVLAEPAPAIENIKSIHRASKPRGSKTQNAAGVEPGLESEARAEPVGPFAMKSKPASNSNGAAGEPTKGRVPPKHKANSKRTVVSKRDDALQGEAVPKRRRARPGSSVAGESDPRGFSGVDGGSFCKQEPQVSLAPPVSESAIHDTAKDEVVGVGRGV